LVLQAAAQLGLQAGEIRDVATLVGAVRAAFGVAAGAA
jgi:hypothetical protein